MGTPFRGLRDKRKGTSQEKKKRADLCQFANLFTDPADAEGDVGQAGQNRRQEQRRQLGQPLAPRLEQSGDLRILCRFFKICDRCAGRESLGPQVLQHLRCASAPKKER